MTKRERIYLVASVLANLTILYGTLYAVSYCFRTDVIFEKMWLGYTGAASLRFFTILSNIYAAVAAGCVLVFAVRALITDRYRYPAWVLTLKYSAAASVCLTFLTVALFLGPLMAMSGRGYFTLFAGNMFFLHLVTPLLAVCSFLFWERGEKLPFRRTVWGLLPVVAYSAVYIVMVAVVGEARGGWADFYNLTFGGNLAVASFSALAMYAATFGICVALRAGQQAYIRRTPFDKT